MSVTLSVFQPVRLIVLRLEQLLNNSCMSVTLVVFQFERSREVRLSQSRNILLASVIASVLARLKSMLVHSLKL